MFKLITIAAFVAVAAGHSLSHISEWSTKVVIPPHHASHAAPHKEKHINPIYHHEDDHSQKEGSHQHHKYEHKHVQHHQETVQHHHEKVQRHHEPKHTAPIYYRGQESCHKDHKEEADHKYKFSYGVHDGTGDKKSQKKVGDGKVVKGSYTVAEADGTIKTVHYTADKHNGFNAFVEKSGSTVHHEASVAHVAPEYRRW